MATAPTDSSDMVGTALAASGSRGSYLVAASAVSGRGSPAMFDDDVALMTSAPSNLGTWLGFGQSELQASWILCYLGCIVASALFGEVGGTVI